MTEHIEPHPKNVPGPFYVENGCCTACDVPFTLAPDHFAYDGEGHCYVKRQPVNKEEIDRMLRAAWAAELECIRYRGQGPEVLRRLGEAGEPQLCDVPPPETVRPVLRNHVTFAAASAQVESMTLPEIAVAYQEYLRSLNGRYMTYEFTPIVLNEASVSFSYSWSHDSFHPVEILAISLPNCRWLIRHSLIEKAGSRGASHHLDDWLKSDGRFCNVRWYSEEQWRNTQEWQDAPW